MRGFLRASNLEQRPVRLIVTHRTRVAEAQGHAVMSLVGVAQLGEVMEQWIIDVASIQGYGKGNLNKDGWDGLAILSFTPAEEHGKSR